MKNPNQRSRIPDRWRSSVQILCALLCLSLFTGIAHAQENVKVSGSITAASDGSLVYGANIVVKGTSEGVISDLDGQFSITVAPSATLVFSFVGYKTQEVAVDGKQKLDIVLVEDSKLFDELVVIGYGVQKKKLVTGATAQVKGDDIQKMNTTSALQAIQGQTAGVQISSNSGQPGENMKVIIRGAGTTGNPQPLYIVDGIQTGDIAYLNNSDIASIDVLKDAASAAIYGSQAANGVVLITTKTGTKGKAKLSFDSYYGFQNVERKIDMLNSEQYATIMNEASINSGGAALFTADDIAAMGKGTNWLDKMFYDDAVTQNYSLGVSGGSENSIYSMGISYTGQEGIVGGPSVSNYDRYNFRVNTEHNLLKDIVKIGQHLTFSYVDNNGIGVGNQYNNSLRGAYNTSPFLPMYDDKGNYLTNTSGDGVLYDGELWTPWSEGESNPYASMMLNNQRKKNNQKMMSDFYMAITPVKGLTLKTTFGVDYYASESRTYTPVYKLSMYDEKIHDAAGQDLSKGLAWTWDNIVSYDFDIKKNSFTVLAGTSAYQNRGTSMHSSKSDLVISDLEHAYIDNGTNTEYNLLKLEGSPDDEDMMNSYFGRLSYNFDEKYMFNATFRADGSSKFASNNRWGYFPSVSAGWVVSNEDFFSPISSKVDFFKLRGSWGQVGNKNSDPWQYMSPIKTSRTNYYFGSEDYNSSGNTVGAYPNRIANLNLKWETSEQLDFGFDARMLRSRLGVNFDWYQKTTKDWLLQANVLGTAGAEAPFINGGNVENKGIELVLSWNDKIGAVNYFVSANVAKNSNSVTDVPTINGRIQGLDNMLYDNSPFFYYRAAQGQSVGAFYGFKTDGVFQNEAEVANYKSANGTIIQPNAKPGDLKYVDVNKDGSIGQDDKTYIGDPNPDFVYGFSLGCDYKGIDFSITANGVAGNQLVQAYRNNTNQKANYTTAVLSRWHGEGTSNSTPRVLNTATNIAFSDIYVQDGDFLRISNITLGYDMSKLLNKTIFSKARIYASVQNAITFTKYDGMDPEIGYGVEDGSAGVDLGFYPHPRTYMVGVNINF